MSPAAQFLIVVLAAVLLWDLIALATVGRTGTISHQMWTWSSSHPWFPWLYFAAAILLGIHFFGFGPPWGK